MTDTDETEAPAADFETCDYREEDLAEVMQVFRDAIMITAAGHYDEAQRRAWAIIADDETAFAAALAEGWVRLAVDEQGVVGFAQINMPGHIQMLYTAPRAARQGVATLLLDDMLALGEAMGAETLTADASTVAQPLFAYFGFVDEGIERIERNGQHFERHRMRRPMKRARR